MQSKQASAAHIHPQSGWEPPLTGQARRLFLIVLASVIMAVNIKSFVDAGGLFPGGFNGLTLLIQRSAQQFAGIALPFTAINLLLNAIPAVISFRLIGKRFTLYSCLMIALTSVLTDIIPSMPLTNDVLLVCIFGGIINGFSISLCLLGRATSGGTDFIAVALSERLNVDAWNYIFIGNCLMLAVAGVLFGWDKALYSIIFQFASTQIVHMLDQRFKRNTLFIISNRAPEIYEHIKDTTHHGATLFHGTGLYNGEERDLIYSVIASDQVKEITHAAREIDPHAFINILKTDQVAGNFYRRPHD
ncbi:YitT family protein [Candidatus Agathobaculum pullicola]|uniref:YitT family protein n=1 Tax=Candidatus Agathobaculum pullicola TaxID=2838426 RepID=UPI003F92D16E